MSIYSDSERLFNSRDIYDVLDISPEAMPRQIRTAVYQLIMHEHPDLKAPEQYVEAFDKCRLLYRVLQYLTNKGQRPDSDYSVPPTNSIQKTRGLANLMAQCLALFTFPLDGSSPRENFQRNYKGSLLEKEDIKAAYILGKGSLSRILTEVPLTTVRDEARIKKIIKGLIKAKELKVYKKFANDSAVQRRTRRKRFAALAAEDAQNKAMDQLLMKYSKDLDKEASDYNDDDDCVERTPARPDDVLLSNCNGNMELLMSNLTLKYHSDSSSTQMDWDEDYVEQLRQKDSRNLRAKLKGYSNATKSRITVRSKSRKSIKSRRATKSTGKR